ncbi:MAG: NlpC/P60 family protein [Flavobacteriaceae bacterium]
MADDTGEMISQLLYGEHFKVIDERKYWFKIRTAFDQCVGWVAKNQISLINEADYTKIESSHHHHCSKDLIAHVEHKDLSGLMPIVLGSSLPQNCLEGIFEGNTNGPNEPKTEVVGTALLYLNAPYLHGGRTPFGIDSAGLAQMVYKMVHCLIARTPHEQAQQGVPLSFIEESEAGDLAFFDNNEGIIDHVGIIMDNNYIIHSYGKVRIDRLDHTGIFNAELKKYTHKLRVIKKII